MPRKLIAAQVVVVVGLVALVYFTLLRPDDGGPPQVVDAPGENQALVPDDPNRDPNGRGDQVGQGDSGFPGGSLPGGVSPLGPGGLGGEGGPGSGVPGIPGSPESPGSPGSPPGGEGTPPNGGPSGGGQYGPGDDQYGSAITRLQARMGIAPAETLTP